VCASDKKRLSICFLFAGCRPWNVTGRKSAASIFSLCVTSSLSRRLISFVLIKSVEAIKYITRGGRVFELVSPSSHGNRMSRKRAGIPLGAGNKKDPGKLFRYGQI
jgi:hypothetical protein